MVNHFRKSCDTSIVHVRGGYRNVPQCRRPKLADVSTPIRELVQASVRSRIGELTPNVIKAGVLKDDVHRRSSLILERSVEIPTAVALEAGRSFPGEEQDLTAFCSIGNGIRVIAMSIKVVRRIHGNNRSFERSDRLGDIINRIKRVLGGKGLREEPLINRITCNPAKKLILV